MSRILLLLVLLFTMQSPSRAYEEMYERFAQNINRQETVTPLYQRMNADSIGQIHNTQRSHKPERTLHNQQATLTVRDHIDSASLSIKHYFNSSNNDNQRIKNNSKRKSQAYEEETKMVYPSDIENYTSYTSLNKMKTSNCVFDLCEEVEDYPVEKIERILKRSELKKFFTSETIIINRFGEHGENLCQTVSHTRFPKTAKNMQNKEQVIVNVDQYKQGVEFETCVSEGPCSYADSFPENITPKCVQKYTVRKLMVVGKESDDTVFDDFKIPSCCVCMVQKSKK